MPTHTPPDLDRLLERTSRTFALSIPLLPEPTRNEVTVAYLLFRIADTFEDAAVWTEERRISALTDFAALLGQPADEAQRRAEELAAAWADGVPSAHRGYLELLAATPFVLARYAALSDAARERIGHHTVRTAEGWPVSWRGATSAATCNWPTSRTWSTTVTSSPASSASC